MSKEYSDCLSEVVGFQIIFSFIYLFCIGSLL